MISRAVEGTIKTTHVVAIILYNNSLCSMYAGTLLVLYVMGLLVVPSLSCIKEYHALERSLLRSPQNIDLHR